MNAVTIDEFLTDRINEDERCDLLALAGDIAWTPEVERRIRSTYQGVGVQFNAGGRRIALAMATAFPGLNQSWIRRQAAPYADHPDYDESWRP